MALSAQTMSSGVDQDAEASHSRGTPPGSMRFFAVLFSAPAARPLLNALYAFEAELRDTVASANHDLAHTRLQWWRDEVALLAERRPRHPVTIAMAPALADRPGDLERLRELTDAAALDLARYTYLDWAELDAYCRRAAGSLQVVIAGALAAPAGLGEDERQFAERLGLAVRQTEMLRDFEQDLRRGLLYVPTDALSEADLDPRGLSDRLTDPALATLLEAWRVRVETELDALPALLDRRQRRRQTHGLVLAALHRRLLSRISQPGTFGAMRADLPAVARLWTAWRTAIGNQRP